MKVKKKKRKKYQKEIRPEAIAKVPTKPSSLGMMHLLIKAKAIIYLTAFQWKGKGEVMVMEVS